MQSRERTGGQAIIDALIDQGVEIIFGYPGGAIMPTYDALHGAEKRIRHVLVRHEQGAAHAAEGYARVSGRVGVALVTSGPGATNLITGLMDALMDSTPIVCITGQVRSPLLGSDAFQESDVVGLTLAATKWSYQITDPSEIPEVIARAFEIAKSGRPGPVLIDVTRDAQAGPVAASGTGDIRHPVYQRNRYPRDRADLSGVDRAAALLNSARRPLLFVGQGVLISRAERKVLALAEKAGLPVASTLLGLSAVPADHPLNVGLLGMHGNYGPNVLTNEADVILAVGMRFDDRVTGRLDDYATGAKIIHVEIDPAEVNRNVRAEVRLIADAGEALDALLPLVKESRHPDWLARFREHDAEEHARVIAAELSPGTPELRMGEVMELISARTRGQAVIVSDVGQHQMIAARHYRFRAPLSHITSGGLGTMGYALPAAIGAALGAPDRQVIAVIGDGGFQMSMQELGTLVQEDLPLKIVILNNQYLGMVRQWQELFFDGRYAGVAMQNPDFVALCASYGLPGTTVDAREDLPGAVERMLETPGAFLLEVRVGKTDNVFPMIPAGASVSEIRLE
ncbi:MAG: biosynthetic-type acetolactate synthase large subunit [Gammaproteobacteria bacterium]|nr:biosynthetic-type acetolactate synthase large subunit [Gammaproteobacteria bacterium]